MIRKLLAICAIVLAAGCGLMGPAKLDPGASRAEVEKAMGKPTETLTSANGDTLLYFSRMPDGRVIFKATMGPDGKLKGELEQTLTRRSIAAIKTGVQAKEVRELLGPPAKSSRKTVPINYEPEQRDVWEYPYLDVSEMRKAWLQFSTDGVLREKNDGLDYEADKYKSLN